MHVPLSDPPRLYVAARKKVRIHNWNNAKRKFVHYKVRYASPYIWWLSWQSYSRMRATQDHILGDDVMVLRWLGASLLAAFKTK